jgi:hypothetical protein
MSRITTRITQIHLRNNQKLGQFSVLGACVFWLVVVGSSGGITAFLILWVAPWTLDWPLPARAFIPFAFVGLLGPLAVFAALCKYSRFARRLFFVPGDDSSPVVKESDKASGS